MAIHKCIICGNSYNACVECSKYGGWRSVCDTPSHYKIYSIIQGFRLGSPVDELKEQLLSIPENDRCNLLPEVEAFLKDNILLEQSKLSDKTSVTKKKVLKKTASEKVE